MKQDGREGGQEGNRRELCALVDVENLLSTGINTFSIITIGIVLMK
jgi:hypothetical protein